MKIEKLLEDLGQEIKRGHEKHGQILSVYDGLARIEEELNLELRPAMRSLEKLCAEGFPENGIDIAQRQVYAEALQVASLAARLAVFALGFDIGVKDGG